MSSLSDLQRKQISVISKYCIAQFKEEDWYTLGQISGHLEIITSHNRLLRALSFSDDDYGSCVAEVINKLCSEHPDVIDTIIDHFDIDLWYQNISPSKYERIFGKISKISADFWSERSLRVFFSHLSSNKEKVSALAIALKKWGVETFVAHEDIEPSREWMAEVEKGLLTMDAMLAVVEPGFKESNWCSQEVGFALGRGIDVIPLRVGMDPYGLFGKYQGVQAKGRYPSDLAEEIMRLLIKKPNISGKIIANISPALLNLNQGQRISMISAMDSWNILGDKDLKSIIEGANIDKNNHFKLSELISRVGAYSSGSANVLEDDAPPF